MLQPLSRQLARSEWLAALCAASALLCAAAGFSGWALGLRDLSSFGARLPIWPLTAVGLFALAAGLLVLIFQLRALGTTLIAIPVAIAALALYEHLSGTSLWIDQILFSEAVATIDASAPGRPQVQVIVEWLFLSAAAMLAVRRTQRTGIAACLIAALPLALATMSLAVALVGVPPGEEGGRFLVRSVPAALAAILLSAAIFLWCRDIAWSGRASAVAGPILARVFPVVLLLPAVTSSIELAADRFDLASHLVMEAAAGAINVVLVAAILAWTMTRLLQQQSKLRERTEALDSAPIAIVDREGTILHWSRGCEQLYGWTAQEAVGASKHALTKTSPPGADAALADLEPDGCIERELTEQTRDGRTVEVLEQARRVDSGGADPLVVLAMADISDRVAMEQALRVSQERLSEAVTAHQVGIFEWDVASGVLSWSPGSEQRLGLVPGSISSFEGWRSQVVPEDLDAVLATIADARARQAERFSFHYRFLQPNGTARAIEGSARCFYDGAGDLVRTAGVVIDVSEREAREAELEAQTAQLRTMLDTVPDALVVIDEQGTILRFGAGAVRTLGYSAEEAVGQSYLIFAPEDLRDRYADTLSKYLESGERRLIGRVTQTFARRADGTDIPVELRVGEAMAGGARLFTLFIRDISDRLANEDHLSSLSAELAHISRLSAMGEMAAGIAHELNQPLTAVSNYVAAAGAVLRQQGCDAEKAREMVAMAGKETIRAGQIIRRMRNFTAKGQVEVSPEPLGAIVREAVELVFVGRMPLDVRIDYDLDPGADVILVDRIQVQQVLVNLIRNAVQAMQEANSARREILLRSRQAGNGMIEIGVSDSGPGIPEAVREKLFEPFTSSSGKNGMGIGLSICRRIIEAHGGSIAAEDRAEGGTTFRFTVPGFEREE